jgi:hypothetical protein
MAIGWEDNVKDEYQAYMPDSAKKLGINVFAYASAMRAWAKDSTHAMKFMDREETSTDKMSMVQVVYDGVWKTRHAGCSVLHTFNTRTDIPVSFELEGRRLSSKTIFDAPLLYLTGHEHFTLKQSEAANLRRYLMNGGFLFAEACCGRKGFDLAFRQLMRTVLPGRPLEPIPAESVIYHFSQRYQELGCDPGIGGAAH